MRPLRLVSLLGFALLAITVCGPDAPMSVVHFKVDPGVDPAGVLGIDAEPLFVRSTAELLADRTDPGVPDLTRWFRVRVPRSEAASLAASLLADPAVDTAFVAPEPQLPSLVLPAEEPTDGPSCPVRTPSYAPYQGYLSIASAGGIDVPAAWARPGGRGTDVWFADIEGGWNNAHEDLPGDRITHVAGRPFDDRGWIAHGTAVLGEVVGRDNGLGVTGIAPDTERVFTASIGDLSTAAAIDAAPTGRGSTSRTTGAGSTSRAGAAGSRPSTTAICRAAPSAESGTTPTSSPARRARPRSSPALRS